MSSSDKSSCYHHVTLCVYIHITINAGMARSLTRLARTLFNTARIESHTRSSHGGTILAAYLGSQLQDLPSFPHRIGQLLDDASYMLVSNDSASAFVNWLVKYGTGKYRKSFHPHGRPHQCGITRTLSSTDKWACYHHLVNLKLSSTDIYRHTLILLTEPWQ